MTGFPWSTGDTLKAADLNAAIAPQAGPFLPTKGGVMTGALVLESTTDAALHIIQIGSTNWPGLVMDTAASTGTAAGYIESRHQGVLRWSIEMGSTDPGSGFLINRWDDGGAVVYPSPVYINRQTAQTTLQSLSVLGNSGFNGTAPIAKPTGVPVTAAGIHAALVAYGLISP